MLKLTGQAQQEYSALPVRSIAQVVQSQHNRKTVERKNDEELFVFSAPSAIASVTSAV
jgi:hypothetical protein